MLSQQPATALPGLFCGPALQVPAWPRLHAALRCYQLPLLLPTLFALLSSAIHGSDSGSYNKDGSINEEVFNGIWPK